MKIVVCGSMSASVDMMKCYDYLVFNGHEVVLPRGTEKYGDMEIGGESAHESTRNKIEHDLIRVYFEKIKDSDVVLVANIEKDGIANYIGGNTFLEMGFAHVLGKRIFLLNPVPNARYKDEIIAMQPVVLNGDLGLVR